MSKLEQGWYEGKWYHHWYHFLLLPLCMLFGLLALLRRFAFAIGIKKSYKLPLPVIVVGNISVGGNGKTPFVIWLVNFLRQYNIRAGVISRGYGSNSKNFPLSVCEPFDTNIHGDEPVLIASRCECPVVIGPNRVVSGEYIAQHFDIDVIICDDGMQHYRLERDIEIAIVDSQRQFGNGWLMPIGPLRELKSRLHSVDYVIYNGNNPTPDVKPDSFFELECAEAINLVNHQPTDISKIHGNVHGLCAIGNPQRFETTLKHYLHQHQLTLSDFNAFADHHRFSDTDFAYLEQDPVFMTEKDAVKCLGFAKPNWHYLPVNARLPEQFAQSLLTDIKNRL